MADEEQKPKASKKSKAPEAGETPQAKGEVPAKKAKATEPAEVKTAKTAAKAEPYSGPPRKSMKPAKLQKKNTPHLPRKVKKAQKKAAAAQARVTSTPSQS